MRYEVRFAVLDDWPVLRDYWDKFRTSPRGHKIEGDVEVLQPFFLTSITEPQRVWLLLLLEPQSKNPAGLCLCQLQAATRVSADKNKIEFVPAAFIRAVVIDPGVPAAASDTFLQHIEYAALQRGCVEIYGHCRPNFPKHTAEARYEFRCKNVIMSKTLSVGGSNGQQ